MQNEKMIFSHSSSSSARVKKLGRGWRVVAPFMVSLHVFSATPSETHGKPQLSAGGRDHVVLAERPPGVVQHRTAGLRVELPARQPVVLRTPAPVVLCGRAQCH